MSCARQEVSPPRRKYCGPSGHRGLVVVGSAKLAQCIKVYRPDVVLLLYIGWVYHRHSMITLLPTICKTILPGIPCVTQFENVDTDPLPDLWGRVRCARP